MRKFLSGIFLSATIIAGNAPLVLANPTNLKTGNSVTVNSVAPKSSLVEFGGRTLTDAEAAKVEGEIAPLVILGWAAKGAALGTVLHGASCAAKFTNDCGWQGYAKSAAFGAVSGGPSAGGAVAKSVAGAAYRKATIPVFLNSSKKATFRVWR